MNNLEDKRTMKTVTNTITVPIKRATLVNIGYKKIQNTINEKNLP